MEGAFFRRRSGGRRLLAKVCADLSSPLPGQRHAFKRMQTSPSAQRSTLAQRFPRGEHKSKLQPNITDSPPHTHLFFFRSSADCTFQSNLFLQPKPVVAQDSGRRSQGSWSVLHERGNAAANLGKRDVCDRLVCILRHGHALQGKRGGNIRIIVCFFVLVSNMSLLWRGTRMCSAATSCRQKSPHQHVMWIK